MKVKCRYPGCEIMLHTTTGRDYHETTAHGMIYNQPLQPLYQQMQLFSDVSRIVRSTELQITEILDIAFMDMINTHIHQSG
ncbi:MAG: hypothetical protein U9P81_03905 [Euryarchaeota archaeon]|nr:hypothetical protein [Euryarchaeota archaeon]